ncbi:hypothetical protein ACOSP7_003278 [Xanthoceras sorbifolium]
MREDKVVSEVYITMTDKESTRVANLVHQSFIDQLAFQFTSVVESNQVRDIVPSPPSISQPSFNEDTTIDCEESEECDREDDDEEEDGI